jgi:hypothetical protein
MMSSSLIHSYPLSLIHFYPLSSFLIQFLFNLQQNYDKEKEALLQALRDGDGRFASERHRQAELARLRREERKARHEDKFDTAALVLGLAQAQKANLEEM